MVPVDIADEIHIKPAEEFSFTCNVPDLSEGNLVISALRMLGHERLGASLQLVKNIPTGAGMGGGSSDAAAMLLADQAGVFGNAATRDYLKLARMLGSDVPFFLVETGALVEGTGERVTAIGALPRWYALVVRPPVAISTAEAYQALDAAPRETRPRNASVSLAMVEALQNRDFDCVLSLLSNDFESAVTAAAPEIAQALNALRKAGAQKALLTGSGSCVFTLAHSRDECERMVSALDLEPSFNRYICAFNEAPAWRAERPG